PGATGLRRQRFRRAPGAATHLDDGEPCGPVSACAKTRDGNGNAVCPGRSDAAAPLLLVPRSWVAVRIL
ncbi:MAG: hypothetical protein M3Q10_19435, partial [Chloroflexota bacterium]|nr:hypothetical protein [Chloroflexota bacterium]